MDPRTLGCDQGSVELLDSKPDSGGPTDYKILQFDSESSKSSLNG